MNGPIYEMALVSLAAQARVAGDGAVMARLWPDHIAFQYTQWVAFAEPVGGDGGGDAERTLAADPPAWVERLRAEGVSSIALVHGLQTDAHMDRMTSGFVGGGRRWRIRTSNGARHDSWEPRVALDHEARDRMIKAQSAGGAIWRSCYLRHDEASHGPFDADLQGAAEALAMALEDVIAFAGRHDDRGWVDAAFAPALDLLERRRGLDPDRARLDFAPFARVELSGRLLNAVMLAWVFGGMGSWNDQVFGENAAKDEFERVSEALYLALHRAIAAGVNGNGSARRTAP
jgi:hypothetical protein